MTNRSFWFVLVFPATPLPTPPHHTTPHQQGYSPAVMINEVVGTEAYVFMGETSTYSRGDLCGAPANETGWIDPGLHHKVSLSYAGQALDPATLYEYYVGDLSKEMRGPLYLRTPPAQSAEVR